jgi:hypothetical protein
MAGSIGSPSRGGVGFNGLDDASVGGGESLADDQFSLASYFEDPDKFQSMKQFSKSVQAFPTQSPSYNDISGGGRYSLRSQMQDRVTRTRALPFSSLDEAPHFVANSKAPVCRVLAYFMEAAPMNLVEPERARKVELIFHLEDNTMEIIEPYIPNCGIMQGKMLKRHRVPKPATFKKRGAGEVAAIGTGDAVDTEFYSITDVRAGAKLIIYQREYTVMDCDGSTKRLLREYGSPFGEPLATPATVYDPRVNASVALVARTAQVKARTTKKSTGFFEYDRKVLRFYGIWDSRARLFGDQLKVRLHYYLADNTMEVLPSPGPSDGRDKVPKYLKKTSVLMEMDDNNSINDSTLMSNEPETAGPDAVVPSRPYHWTDLKVGMTIAVAALNITIIDADPFTRRFYDDKDMPLATPIPLQEPIYPVLKNNVPPHDGFGSEEDSLQTCTGSLVPTAPKKDGAKLRNFQGMILRFFAKLEKVRSEDEERTFVVQLFLEDDTVLISEPPVRNSGHKGGTFLSRTKLSLTAGGHGSAGLQIKQCYVGASVQIFSHHFKLLDADDYTMRYMAENSLIWGYSNFAYVLGKLKERGEALRRNILTSNTAQGLASKEVDKGGLGEILLGAGIVCNDQEIATIFHKLDPLKTGVVKMSKVLKLVA